MLPQIYTFQVYWGCFLGAICGAVTVILPLGPSSWPYPHSWGIAGLDTSPKRLRQVNVIFGLLVQEWQVCLPDLSSKNEGEDQAHGLQSSPNYQL